MQVMRYIVSLTKLMNIDHETAAYFPWEGGHEPPENITTETRLVLCDTIHDVERAISGDNEMWQIFELVGGRAESRAIRRVHGLIAEIL